MTNPVVQWQLVSTNPDAAASFYRELFGWKISTNNAMGYREVETGGVKGGIWPAPPEAPNFVQLFIAVPDVPASIERATSLGAKVIIPATTLPDGDVMAILADPNGVTFGVMAG